MSATLTKIERFIGDLATSLRDEAEIGTKIEGARVLAAYYAALKKAEAKPDDEDSDELTISGLQDQLAKVTEQGNGSGRVSSRRRGRAGADN